MAVESAAPTPEGAESYRAAPSPEKPDLAQLGREALTGGAQKIGGVYTEAKEAGRELADVTKEIGSEAWQAASEKGREAWEGIKNRYESVAAKGNSLKEKAKGLLGRLGSFAGNLGLKAVGAVARPEGRRYVSETVKGKAADVAQRVENGVTVAWETTRSKTAEAGNRLRERGTAAYRGAQERINGVVTGIQDAALQERVNAMIRQDVEMDEALAEIREAEEAEHMAVRQKYQDRIDKLGQTRQTLQNDIEGLTQGATA